MKYIFNNQNEFSTWREKMSLLYTFKSDFKSKKLPINYPCIVVGWVIENDYIGKDWIEYEIIHKTDFEDYYKIK